MLFDVLSDLMKTRFLQTLHNCVRMSRHFVYICKAHVGETYLGGEGEMRQKTNYFVSPDLKIKSKEKYINIHLRIYSLYLNDLVYVLFFMLMIFLIDVYLSPPLPSVFIFDAREF